MKANEFLNRRATVEDIARAHVLALERAPQLGFDISIISAPTPFSRADRRLLRQDAAAVIARHFPDAAELYDRRGWRLPDKVGRVYDATHAEAALGFRAETDFAAILNALREDAPLPFAHDEHYASPAAEHGWMPARR
jgi:nucleoside-diphosphate-sugar epimerase